MGHWTDFCLKTFLSTKIFIKGKENILSDQKFFIASSHQSMFETFYLQTIFNSPVFILKKELLMIPMYVTVTRDLACVILMNMFGP